MEFIGPLMMGPLFSYYFHATPYESLIMWENNPPKLEYSTAHPKTLRELKLIHADMPRS